MLSTLSPSLSLSFEWWASHRIKVISYEPRFCHYAAYVVPKMLSLTWYSVPAWHSRERLWSRRGCFLTVLWKLRLKNSIQTVKQGSAHQIWIAHLFSAYFSPFPPFAERTPLPRYLYVVWHQLPSSYCIVSQVLWKGHFSSGDYFFNNSNQKKKRECIKFGCILEH